MIPDDLLAHDLATEAGQRLLDLRRRSGFGDAAALRAAGDRLSHEYITAALASRRPDDAVLSEEGKDSQGRLSACRVWIVDPLDGTREFGEPGRRDWAVHVALWQRAALTARPGGTTLGAPQDRRDGRLVAGAVALPAEGRTFGTLQPAARGAASGGAAAGRLRLVVSRTRPPEFVRKLATDLAADLVPLGSAGTKIIAVLTGDADAYVHAGGQYEWDSAAPVAVAQAAGLHASRIDGSPLEYNQPDPRLPDILVCRPEIAATLLAGIRGARSAEG